ncbi:MAG TPA: EamA family transporter [Devosia sp.]|jgi:O-acetylserine/cysteine efflux transporter|nr:EamA family transporter [Devosia sp.]
MSPRDLLIALVIVLVWGLNFIAIKWGVALVPPLLLTALRYVFAAIPAVFFVPRPRVRLSTLLLYGTAVGVLQFGSLFVAIKLGMPAGLSSLVIQMQAFFTMAFAAVLLGDRPGRFQLIGALVALAGIALIALERLSGTALLPLLLTLAGAAFWGVANIATKRAGKIDMLGFVVWSALVPPIPLIALSLLTEGAAADWAALSHPSWLLAGIVGFNAYAATLIGFGLWSVLLARYPASTVVPFSLLVPVVGITSGVLLLGEPLSPFEAIGSAIVFIGLLLNVFGARLALRLAVS